MYDRGRTRARSHAILHGSYERVIKSEHNIRSRSIRSRRRRRRRLAHQSYTKLTQEEKVTQTCARCTLFQLRTHALDSNANTIAASYSFVIVTTTETRLRNNNTMLLFAYVSLSHCTYAPN